MFATLYRLGSQGLLILCVGLLYFGVQVSKAKSKAIPIDLDSFSKDQRKALINGEVYLDLTVDQAKAIQALAIGARLELIKLADGLILPIDQAFSFGSIQRIEHTALTVNGAIDATTRITSVQDKVARLKAAQSKS